MKRRKSERGEKEMRKEKHSEEEKRNLKKGGGEVRREGK
jgi:hypothetical protein